MIAEQLERLKELTPLRYLLRVTAGALRLLILLSFVRGKATVVPRRVQPLTLLVEQAHQLLNQFALDSSEQAWESMADLRQLLGQLQQLYPPRPFRQRHS